MASNDDRQQLVASAVRFLKDPKVQAAALTKKVAFLEKKGLTSTEIQEALATAAAPGSAGLVAENAMTLSATPATSATSMMPTAGGINMINLPPPPLPPPPPPAKLTWKDYFIAAVVIGGVSYGFLALFKRYLGPLIDWPSKEDWGEDKKALEKQHQKTSELLLELKASVEAAVNKVQAQEEQIQNTLNEAKESLSKIGENDAKREVALHQVNLELDQIRSSLPRMLELMKEKQTTVLNELQEEVRSLKGLFRVRSGSSGSMAGSPSTGAAGSMSGATTESSVVASILNNAGSATIPSWQKATTTSAVGETGKVAPTS